MQSYRCAHACICIYKFIQHPWKYTQNHIDIQTKEHAYIHTHKYTNSYNASSCTLYTHIQMQIHNAHTKPYLCKPRQIFTHCSHAHAYMHTYKRSSIGTRTNIHKDYTPSYIPNIFTHRGTNTYTHVHIH